MYGHHLFADRAEAAEALALQLLDYQGKNPLVLAIPRGAVPMGKIIAERLHGQLDVVLVRKLGAPFDPEYAIGAIDETGWTYLAPVAKRFGEEFPLIRREKARQLEVLKTRRAQYTPHRSHIDRHGRIVIVVDDGIATGATMIAALHAVRAAKPAEVICAIPVAPPESLDVIRPLTDRLICLYAPEEFMSVGQFYRDFRTIDDDEVIRLLMEAGSPDPIMPPYGP
jgi:putative phosphoribosyl transferase